MALTSLELARYREQGYVELPGLVPRALVETARKAINRSLGLGVPPERIAEMRHRSFCPELERASIILDLLHRSEASALAESLIGAGRMEPVRAAQIALVFPTEPEEATPLRPHLDGRHTPFNGVPPGELRSFTMLVGVLLSDVPRREAGNFTVWPGSHRLYETYFREHGGESLVSGMPPIALPEPVQLVGAAGDVVLAHWQLAHCAAPNVSPDVRYAVFFRLRHVEHEAQKWRALTDLWLEYEGITRP